MPRNITILPEIASFSSANVGSDGIADAKITFANGEILDGFDEVRFSVLTLSIVS